MAKAKVNKEIATPEASPTIESPEAPVELEEDLGNDTNAEPTLSPPAKVEKEAALAVVPGKEDQQANGGKRDEVKNDEVNDGKTEELDQEKAKDGGMNEEEKKTKLTDQGNVEGTLSKNTKRARRKRKAVMAEAGSPATPTTANDKKEELKKELKTGVGSSLSKRAKLRKARMQVALSTAAGAADASVVKDSNPAGTSAAIAAKEELKREGESGGSLAKKAKLKKERNKAALSAAAGASKKVGMGLVFMCSAKTKQDCFKYKVFGLPASKKETVAKVYKGMRLFLFDIDLKLMYGIYKAAAPGGYNIEPKAFKSAFPSQVRFTVLDDCLPLPEEKFKAAIKENYYGKNKFNCELSQEQVKNLCKIFQNPNKPSKSRRNSGSSRREEAPSSINRDRKRRRLSDPVNRRPVLDRQDRTFLRNRKAYASPPPRQIMLPRYASPPRQSLLPRYASPPRQSLLPRYASPPRQSLLPRYASPPRQSLLPLYASPPRAAPPALPPPAYAYERPVDIDYYRRDPGLEIRSDRIVDREMRPRDPVEYYDPYSLYREPLPYREPVYPSGLQVGYHVPPPAPPQYPQYRY